MSQSLEGTQGSESCWEGLQEPGWEVMVCWSPQTWGFELSVLSPFQENTAVI